MKKNPLILVAGLLNIETILPVEGFPVDYAKSRFLFGGIRDTVSGVGMNVALALKTLGHRTMLLSMTGNDGPGRLIRERLRESGLGDDGVTDSLKGTPRTVVLCDSEGRSGAFTDLQDSQESAYPPDKAAEMIRKADWIHVTTINWAYELALEAKRQGKTISTDVQSIRSIDSAYDRRFLEVADIVCISSENLEQPIDTVVQRLWEECGTRMVVVGMGADGALLGERREGTMTHFPASTQRPIVSTIGAGDALCAALVGGLVEGRKPREALKRAITFASWKIGEAGGAQGFLDRESLDALL